MERRRWTRSPGQAIYLFDVETTSQPRCYGPSTDTTQVTYDGHPLYLYAHEGKYEVKCHDVFLNGGTWYAVQPDDDPAP